MADSDDSSVSSSSSSSDSVLIPMPLDQRRRKKLRAQLQEDQRRQRERQEGVSSRRSDADSDRVKTEHICVVCEHEGDELVVCAGPCISAFHVACLPSDSGPAGAKNDAWLCPSCKSKSHACFHCKQKGVEMLPEETATAASADPSKRPVRKCRALSCGKFYHQDCITQFPLARIAIAGTHFICPLHTCAGCNQSGAQQEAVRCMRCPVAYHARCLPANCVRQISSKLIICPKHADEPKETVVVEKKETITNIAVPERAPVSESGSVRMQEVENEDEVMSEASAVSAGSARKREKREKREKRDKKKKKKKKKKDKHKEKRESLASQADDDQDSSRNDGSSGKRKRSKRESSVEAGDRAGIEHADKGGPATPSASRTELGARALVTPLLPTSGYTDGGASRSPTSSFALFESPATANKRIQERLVEALGQSDDDEDSDDTGASPSLKRKRSNNHITGSGMRNTSHGAVKSEHLTQDLSPTLKQDVTKGSPEPSASSSSSAHVLERHGSHSEMDETANNRRVEHQSEQHQSFDSTLKLEIPRSPSASVLIPSSIPSATLELKHVPSDDDEEEDEEGGDKSIGFSSDATPRAIGSAREADMLSTGTPKGGKSGGNQGKKKKKSKSKRALKREISEEDEDNSEAKWVQCDSCKKWRTVPKDFNLDAMPNHWYCNMNTWDVRYASCSVAEEVLKLNPSPDKKSKNRVKRSKSFTVTMTSDGGSSSGTGALKRTTGSSKGSSSDIALLEEKEKRSSKTKDKSSKKRKMTKQLKEKYREVKWVQCESTQCGKWRVVPSSINFDRLPAVWYCHLNTWAPELAKCSAPNPTEVDAFLLKQSKRDSVGSVRPSKKARASSGDAVPASSVTSGGGITPTSSSTDLASISAGKAKYGKGFKGDTPVVGKGDDVSSTPSSTVGGAEGQETNSSQASGSSVVGTGAGGSSQGTDGGSNNGANSSSSKGGRGRSHNSSGGGSTNSSGIKKTVLEWAQCEKCNKWRKLPHHIKSSTLPDKWYCSMNHWDPSHAKCSIPEEADQEPLPLPPHPGSQWHKGGHKQRSKRGKLSYSDLLYGSTGQLRKAYTQESSTLSFEYEGITYHRDGQYKHSSMYVSPAAMAAAATMAGWGGSDRVIRETSCSNINETIASTNEDGAFKPQDLTVVSVPQANIDRVAALVLDSMDLRRRRSISELLEVVNCTQRTAEAEPCGLVSLAVVTAAVGQLEHRGLVEKVTELSDEDEDESSQKRRKTELPLTFGAFSLPAHYRKVPTRPLKASKCWKFGTNVVALSPLKDS